VLALVFDVKCSGWLIDLFDQGHSPPSCRPSIAFVGTSRDQVVPDKGEQREQQRTDANRRNQEAPRQVVDDDDQRIDSGRWVKGAGQVHRDHRQTNRQRRSPGRRPAQLNDQQANQSGDKVAADQRARLCRLGFWRAKSTTIEVANGIATRGNAVVAENASMLAIAIAPPVAPARMARN
jgi:hypothetical protein